MWKSRDYDIESREYNGFGVIPPSIEVIYKRILFSTGDLCQHSSTWTRHLTADGQGGAIRNVWSVCPDGHGADGWTECLLGSTENVTDILCRRAESGYGRASSIGTRDFVPEETKLLYYTYNYSLHSSQPNVIPHTTKIHQIYSQFTRQSVAGRRWWEASGRNTSTVDVGMHELVTWTTFPCYEPPILNLEMEAGR